jgi:hypothetical protein
MALTGRFSFRKTWTGKVVLQLEEEVKTVWPLSRSKPFRRRWRNAKLMDLAAPELRALMDLRYKPQFLAQYQHLVETPAPVAQAPQAGVSAAAPTPYDGIAIPAAHVLGNRAMPREVPQDLTVEVQSFPPGLSGRA